MTALDRLLDVLELAALDRGPVEGDAAAARGARLVTVMVTPGQGRPAARAAAVRAAGSGARSLLAEVRPAGAATQVVGAASGDRLRALVEPVARAGAAGSPGRRRGCSYSVPTCLVAGRAGPRGTRTWTVRGEGGEPGLRGGRRSDRARGRRTARPTWTLGSQARGSARFSAQRRLQRPVLQPVVGAEPPVRHRPRDRVAEQDQDLRSSPSTRRGALRGLGVLEVAGALLAEEPLGRSRARSTSRRYQSRPRATLVGHEHLRLRAGRSRHRDVGVGVEQRGEVGGAAPLRTDRRAGAASTRHPLDDVVGLVGAHGVEGADDVLAEHREQRDGDAVEDRRAAPRGWSSRGPGCRRRTRMR